MENKTAREIFSGGSNDPYITGTIMVQYAYATNYTNVAHPSEPNYVWLEAGTNVFSDATLDTDNDPSGSNSTASSQHLATLLTDAGKHWKAYEEDIAGGSCPIADVNNYAVRHDPFVFFQDIAGSPPSSSAPNCIANVVPFSKLDADIQGGTLPDYGFITPNVIDDMHDGTIADGDSWLQNTQGIQDLFGYVTNPVNRAFLVIVWDECENSSGTDCSGALPMLLVTAPSFLATTGKAVTTALSHTSTVQSLQEIFELTPGQTDPVTGQAYPWLGNAGSAGTNDLSSFFKPGLFP
ncbi:MAG: alkaline phosphatase family protein [Deltaproteobacteria bacterium]